MQNEHQTTRADRVRIFLATCLLWLATRLVPARYSIQVEARDA